MPRRNAHRARTARADSPNITSYTIVTDSPVSKSIARCCGIDAEPCAARNTYAHAIAAEAACGEGTTCLTRRAVSGARRAHADSYETHAPTPHAVAQVARKIPGVGLGIGADAIHQFGGVKEGAEHEVAQQASVKTEQQRGAGSRATSSELKIDRPRMAVRQAVVKSTAKALLAARSVAAVPHSSSRARLHPMSSRRRTRLA